MNNDITKRSITQITSNDNGEIIALCDDGSLWRDSDGYWVKLRSIPQVNSDIDRKFQDLDHTFNDLANYDGNDARKAQELIINIETQCKELSVEPNDYINLKKHPWYGMTKMGVPGLVDRSGYIATINGDYCRRESN